MAFPTTGLVSYWKLDEASGTRVDSHGTNHLTPTNAPVGAAGKIGNGCDFESTSSQYLSHPDPNPLGDEDFTYALWFKRESTGRMQLIGKDDDSSRRFILGFDASNLLDFTNFMGTAGVAGAVLTDTNWHFVVLWCDRIANRAYLQLDDGTPVSGASGSGFVPEVTPIALRIGAREYPGFEDYFDGIIDEVGFWKRVLTAQERTDLYNGGAGLAYSSGSVGSSTDLTTNFIGYLASLKAAHPTAQDLTTLVAKDLPIVRAAHPLPTEVDDLNTLYDIHVGPVS